MLQVHPRLRQLRAHGRSERGFGMIELVAAMTIISVGVLAVYGMLQAGMLQIRRASTVTTAAALADAEMEKLRAVKYEVLGLDDAAVAGADAAYTADAAYRSDTAPATTLQAALDATQTTLTVASADGFPSEAPFLVQIGAERLLVTGGGSGTTTWDVARGQDWTVAAAHGSGAAVTQKHRVHLASCSSVPPPCTSSVPTESSVGADGRSYRVDTYMTWVSTANAGETATGRLHKLVTIVVRDEAAPHHQWARVSSAFDESTGL